MGVCTIKDDFLEHKTIWEVLLDNGLTVFQDDDRIGEEEPSAWIRLKKYVEENKLNIQQMRLRFRDNVVSIGKNTTGFYFAKGCGKDSTQEDTNHFYIVGYLEDSNIFQCLWYKIPELILFDSCTKDANDKTWENNIIWNNYGKATDRKINF